MFVFYRLKPVNNFIGGERIGAVQPGCIHKIQIRHDADGTYPLPHHDNHRHKATLTLGTCEMH